MGEGKRRRAWLICCWVMVSVILAAHLLFTFFSSPVVALGVMFLLGWALPGLLLTLNWRLPGLDWAEVGGISIGLGLVWGLLLAWAVHLLPGAITVRHLLCAYQGGLAVLILMLVRRPPLGTRRPPGRVWVHLLLLITLAACLRLPGLAYAEFQVDETVVLDRAYKALVGEDDAISYHKKGPGEIVTALVPYAALGTATEGTARLPFAMASVGSVVLVYLLGRRLFTPVAGVAAGLLLALNGYALGLSRIAQYQALVLLFMALSFFAAYEFAKGGNPRWVPLVAVSSAGGIFAHYEFGLIVPVLFMLLAWGWRRSPASLRVAWQAVGIFLPIVLTAYVPLVLDRHFGGTQRYLNMRLGTGPHFSGPFFVELGTLYNSIYYFVGLLLLVVAGMILGWRQARLATVGLIVWFAPFLVMYMFVVTVPGAHYYTMVVSWCLLGGYGLSHGMSLLQRSPLWWPAAAAGGVWCALCVGYLYLVFFQQRPEYIQDISANRVPLYWTPYGDAVPLSPRYGFPNRAGWKVVGLLYHWNYLEGSYGSNERGRFLRWYLPNVPKERQADYQFFSKTVQIQDTDFDRDLLSSYQHVGEVRVDGQPKIHIYAQGAVSFPYLIYDAETFAPVFDRSIPALPSERQTTKHILDFRLGDSIWLRGYELETRVVHPGDVFEVTLYWETTAHVTEDYKVFVHLGGQPIWGQHDAMPEQNTYPTSQWDTDEQIVDHTVVAVEAATPPGTYSLSAGIYRWQDGNRLPVYDAGAKPEGDHVVLDTIEVR